MVKTSMQVAAVAAPLNQVSALTRFFAAGGTAAIQNSEVDSQMPVRTSLTARNLLILVTTNTVNGVSTFSSRKNTAAGAMSVSIGNSATGTFEDTTNSDSLVATDLFNFSLVTGGSSGTLSMTVMSCTLDHATTQTSYPVVTGTSDSVSAVTRFQPVSGVGTSTITEAAAQYKIRFAATWSNLHVRVRTNQTTTASTITSRKNTAAGAQTVTIGSAATGSFDDTTNSDTLASGDLIDFSCAWGSLAAMMSINVPLISSQLQTTVTDSFPLVVGNNTTETFGSTFFLPPVGDLGNVNTNTTEARVQLKIRSISATMQNLFLEVPLNTIAANTVITSRKNGVNGNLTVTVGSTATGVFEDTTDNDKLVPGDLYCWQVVTLGGAGAITLGVLGVQAFVTGVAGGGSGSMALLGVG